MIWWEHDWIFWIDKQFSQLGDWSGCLISEPRHEISNNVVYGTSKASDQPAHTRSLIRAFASRLNILWVLIKLLTEHYLEFLSLTGGCTGSSESTLVKMPHCWKSHVTAQVLYVSFTEDSSEIPLLTLCMLGIFHAFLLFAEFFSKLTFPQKIFQKYYQSVKKFGSNCFQMLSAYNSSRVKEKMK